MFSQSALPRSSSSLTAEQTQTDVLQHGDATGRMNHSTGGCALSGNARSPFSTPDIFLECENSGANTTSRHRKRSAIVIFGPLSPSSRDISARLIFYFNPRRKGTVRIISRERAKNKYFVLNLTKFNASQRIFSISRDVENPPPPQNI